MDVHRKNRGSLTIALLVTAASVHAEATPRAVRAALKTAKVATLSATVLAAGATLWSHPKSPTDRAYLRTALTQYQLSQEVFPPGYVDVEVPPSVTGFAKPFTVRMDLRLEQGQVQKAGVVFHLNGLSNEYDNPNTAFAARTTKNLGSHFVSFADAFTWARALSRPGPMHPPGAFLDQEPALFARMIHWVLTEKIGVENVRGPIVVQGPSMGGVLAVTTYGELMRDGFALPGQAEDLQVRAIAYSAIADMDKAQEIVDDNIALKRKRFFLDPAFWRNPLTYLIRRKAGSGKGLRAVDAWLADHAGGGKATGYRDGVRRVSRVLPKNDKNYENSADELATMLQRIGEEVADADVHLFYNREDPLALAPDVDKWLAVAEQHGFAVYEFAGPGHVPFLYSDRFVTALEAANPELTYDRAAAREMPGLLSSLMAWFATAAVED